MAETDSGLRVVLKDVHPLLDGEYPLDPEAFTNRDLHDIKRLAGVLPLEFSASIAKGDTGLIVALAYIAIRKAGNARVNEDALWDAEIGRISLIGETKDDTGPPGPATSSEPPPPAVENE